METSTLHVISYHDGGSGMIGCFGTICINWCITTVFLPVLKKKVIVDDIVCISFLKLLKNIKNSYLCILHGRMLKYFTGLAFRSDNPYSSSSNRTLMRKEGTQDNCASNKRFNMSSCNVILLGCNGCDCILK
ncbi:hypothetical protein X975_25943, partial [Stegodyphus mimosarum]